MAAFHLFDHWTFASFAPGSISRSKYNAFRDIHVQSVRCFELLARFEHLAAGRAVVDWCRVTRLTGELIDAVRGLLDQLQVISPVEFMDVQDWFAKVAFYARLTVAQEDQSSAPPYLLSAAAADAALPNLGAAALDGAAFVILPSVFQYFIEANDLRRTLDELLSSVDMADPVGVVATAEALQQVLRGARMPERLRAELEIAAMDLAPGRQQLSVRVYAGRAAETVLLGVQHAVTASRIWEAWLAAAAAKYTPTALTMRLHLGLADEEHPLSVVVAPAEAPIPDLSVFPEQATPTCLMRRLGQAEPRLSRLHVFQAFGQPLVPNQCRSLHDLVCLCMERGLSQIFAFAGAPARGLGGIKQMRLEVPVIVNVFNLEGGLFPSAAERVVISAEDVRSIPAWSFLLGLTSQAVAWPDWEHDDTQPAPHASSYAVLAQYFMHCTLRLGRNLYAVECHSEDGTDNYVLFRFKGGGVPTACYGHRADVLAEILRSEGFEVEVCGDYLEALRRSEEDVQLQRSLVCLGVVVAWMQVSGDQIPGQAVADAVAAFRAVWRVVKSGA